MESVDWNSEEKRIVPGRIASLSMRGAWIEMIPSERITTNTTSLSARRAWIEILRRFLRQIPRVVALRKESVDWNISSAFSAKSINTSLSAWRAWIEIGSAHRYPNSKYVAIITASFDWNNQPIGVGICLMLSFLRKVLRLKREFRCKN